jgi:uncharacterized protein YcbX
VAEGVLVGRVAAVLRYPVKSMAAEPVEDVDVSWHGLSGDRRWAFMRPDLPSNGFPWLTLRQRNDLTAGQAFTQQARTLAAARGINCVALDYDALRGMEPNTPTLF